MKRFVVGVLWFVCFYFTIIIVGSYLVTPPMPPSEPVAENQPLRDTIREGYEEGRRHGHQERVGFISQYRRIIFWAAFALALGGTTTGFLPGTKSKKQSPAAPTV